MHCSTSSRPLVDLSQASHPRAVHVAVERFVRGARGPRRNPVTRNQICAWLNRTPFEAVDAALTDLVAEGKLLCVALSLRSNRNTAKRAHGYEVNHESERARRELEWAEMEVRAE